MKSALSYILCDSWIVFLVNKAIHELHKINTRQRSKPYRLKYLRSGKGGVNMLAKQTFSAFPNLRYDFCRGR